MQGNLHIVATANRRSKTPLTVEEIKMAKDALIHAVNPANRCLDWGTEKWEVSGLIQDRINTEPLINITKIVKGLVICIECDPTNDIELVYRIVAYNGEVETTRAEIRLPASKLVPEIKAEVYCE